MTARERRLHLEEQRRLEAREVVDGVLRKRAEKSSEGSRNNEHPAPALLAHYGMGTSQMSILEDLFKTVQGQQRMIAELYEKIDGLAETVAEAQPKRNTCVFTQGNQMEQFCETHQTWTFARHDRCYHGREESGR